MTETFTVDCGDWIYPSRTSSSGVQYPIDKPLVAEIFLPEKDAGKEVPLKGAIHKHLIGPRFIKMEFEIPSALRLISLGNHQEELFSTDIDFPLTFTSKELTRTSEGIITSMHDEKISYNDRAIFFTDVLLAVYLRGNTFPKGITFRDATMPEIESLGQWPSQGDVLGYKIV